MKTKKLVIIGDGKFAEIAYEYFTVDSDYEVVGFCVEQAYLQQNSYLGLPVVAFEELEKHYSPADHEFYAAITFTQLNRVRKRLYLAAKAKGYKPASYVSSRAFVWRTAKLGEHVFIFEHNTVQPSVEVGNNVVLWSGNHLGHHGRIRDHVFVSSHVVIAGFCDIGESCFLGVNATIANNVTVGADNWIGMGVSIGKNTEPNAMYKGLKFEPTGMQATRFFKVKE